MATSNNSSGASGGLGLGGALFIVFLVLKLTDVIAWSWWWITAPLWIPTVIVIAVLIIGVIVMFAKSGKKVRR
jgi:hypothetical protein